MVEETPADMMPHHEVAELFPMMSGLDFATFKEDVRVNGLREPIWTWRGAIIDGRNRYRACRELGITPEFREWDGHGSLVAFVVSLNLRRRHLDETQRAVIAAKMKPMLAREAAERKVNTPEKVSEVKADAPGANLRPSGRTSHTVAELMNVSPRSVESARKVLRDGSPELVKAVEAGEVKVSTAAAVAELPKQEQAQAVAKGATAIREAAKRVVGNKRQSRPPKPVRGEDPTADWTAATRHVRGVIRNGLDNLPITPDDWTPDKQREWVDALRQLIDALLVAIDGLAGMLVEGGGGK